MLLTFKNLIEIQSISLMYQFILRFHSRYISVNVSVFLGKCWIEVFNPNICQKFFSGWKTWDFFFAQFVCLYDKKKKPQYQYSSQHNLG